MYSRFFRMILYPSMFKKAYHSKSVVNFAKTPMSLIFCTRGIPGVNHSICDKLKDANINTPTELFNMYMTYRSGIQGSEEYAMTKVDKFLDGLHVPHERRIFILASMLAADVYITSKIKKEGLDVHTIILNYF